MGRLEEAMKRATAERAEREARAAADLPLNGAAAVAVDVDMFPSEAPDAPPPVEVRPAAVAHPAPRGPGSESQPAPQAPVAGVPRTQLTTSEAEASPHLNDALRTKTVADDDMAPQAREQYRRLAAALHQAQRTGGAKVVMIASAVAGEGKSLTAANLALTLSGSYRKTVLLVDADLRRPSQHTVFEVPGAPGLTEGLEGLEEPQMPLHRVSERLTVVPAGRPTSDPIGALTSERMRRMLNEAREVFDWVIIDTPPIALMTDAALLTAMADCVVLVVKAEATPYDLVQRAVDAIGRDRVIGMVLNRAKEQQHQSHYEYYRYYGQSSDVATR